MAKTILKSTDHEKISQFSIIDDKVLHLLIWIAGDILDSEEDGKTTVVIVPHSQKSQIV